MSAGHCRTRSRRSNWHCQLQDRGNDGWGEWPYAGAP
jgi:hypothetical protein